MNRLIVVIAAALLFGCAAPNPKGPSPSAYCPKPDPKAICAGWQPIITHGSDLALMDPATVEEIDAHNMYGLARGCWKRGDRP